MRRIVLSLSVAALVACGRTSDSSRAGAGGAGTGATGAGGAGASTSASASSTSDGATTSSSSTGSGGGSSSTSGAGGGGGGAAVDCSDLAPIGTGTPGKTWVRQTAPVSVESGANTFTKNIDPTSYVQIWSVDYPQSVVPWPGNYGITTRVKLYKNTYLAEGFTVPTDGSVAKATWAFTGSGGASNMALAVSVCPGDFGQTGTHVTPACTLKKAHSSNGLTVFVGADAGCHLTPGQTYYLNVLPSAELPQGDVSVQDCGGLPCEPWLVVWQ